ncbi:MAG: AmmeMemoRadiSam system radical SAM enzyme, partial [Betaproteobacteria bacterium]
MSAAPEKPYIGRWWHTLEDGRLQCDLCPRDCRLHEGQRGACFVRMREHDKMVLTTYGRSSGFCIDPVEKKPLNHFYPGSSILSFGTAGCNLACKFCQNWDISKSRDVDTLADAASPEQLARAALDYGCRSVAFTYNDPVIFAEYAMDVADACREVGVKAVAVTAGYMHDRPRREFYAKMDAANVDLKAFTEEFYFRTCSAHLKDVLDTLVYLEHETEVWFEITTLLIPGRNDGDEEIDAECRWIAKELGLDVPLHFTAFHPDYKMTDIPPTPAATLTRARKIALGHGLRYVYTGNVHDPEGGSTYCP